MANDFITIYEGTDLDVGAREVVEPDGITKRHQTTVIASGQLVLPPSPQISGVSTDGDYPDSGINIAGWGSIVVKSIFSVSNAYCNINFVLYLADGVTLIGISDVIEVRATSRTEGSNYIGEVVMFDNSKIGASYLKLAVSNISDGIVGFYIGGF